MMSAGEEGERLVAKGKKLAAEGERLATEGERLVQKGEQLATDGEPLITGGERLADRPEDFGPPTGDTLPWLESAETDYETGPSMGRIVVLVIGALALIGLAIWGISAMRSSGPAEGTGALINAQEGDYKVKPDEPGGMKVDGEGDTQFATSEGAASNGTINTKAVPEAPVDHGLTHLANRTPAAASQGASKVVAAVPAASGKLTAQSPQIANAAATQGSGGSALVQLGSFPSEEAASLAWSGLSKRFAYLAPLGKSVEKAEVNGRTVYRLRVNAGSNGAASQLCGKLKVAGEACYIPN